MEDQALIQRLFNKSKEEHQEIFQKGSMSLEYDHFSVAFERLKLYLIEIFRKMMSSRGYWESLKKKLFEQQNNAVYLEEIYNVVEEYFLTQEVLNKSKNLEILLDISAKIVNGKVKKKRKIDCLTTNFPKNLDEPNKRERNDSTHFQLPDKTSSYKGTVAHHNGLQEICYNQPSIIQPSTKILRLTSKEVQKELNIEHVPQMVPESTDERVQQMVPTSSIEPSKNKEMIKELYSDLVNLGSIEVKLKKCLDEKKSDLSLVISEDKPNIWMYYKEIFEKSLADNKINKYIQGYIFNRALEEYEKLKDLKEESEKKNLNPRDNKITKISKILGINLKMNPKSVNRIINFYHVVCTIPGVLVLAGYSFTFCAENHVALLNEYQTNEAKEYLKIQSELIKKNYPAFFK